MNRANELIYGQQGRGRYAERMSFASSSQVVQHISILLAQCRHNRQDALNKAATGLTLGSETASTPMTPRRKARSAALLVGSMPSWSTKVQSACSTFKIFWQVLRVCWCLTKVPMFSRQWISWRIGCMAA